MQLDFLHKQLLFESCFYEADKLIFFYYYLLNFKATGFLIFLS